MGCDIHAVLQKKNKETEKFETVIYDVLPGRYYSLFTFLSGVRGIETEYDNIATPGFPEDFDHREDEMGTCYHGNFHMGDHSFGHITLKEFCGANTPDPSDNMTYEIEQHRDGYTVHFKGEDEYDDYAHIRDIQSGLAAMFDTYSEGQDYGETYRLVFGYDS